MTGPIDYRLLIKIDFKICDWFTALYDWPQVSISAHGDQSTSQITLSKPVTVNFVFIYKLGPATMASHMTPTMGKTLPCLEKTLG